MNKIAIHPILDIPVNEKVTFQFEGKTVTGEKGFTIAAALLQAGYAVHSHGLSNRKSSLECGIGKCGACEMLVDGQIRRICITKVDGIREVREIPHDYSHGIRERNTQKPVNVYKTTVAIVGAGPAGLACREELMKQSIDNIVIDNNDKIGGQFLMQTHQFSFFEKEKKFGGMRGFDIVKTLAGDNHEGIFLNSTVWDVLEGKRIAVKNISTEEIYYVDAEYMVVATGAVPFIPAFENDNLPGVYTGAVVQKMMNNEFTLPGKNVLTVGAGNFGYLTSYQLIQAGANVKAIIEVQPVEGGFPVQANRVRRLGIPILTSHILLKAIPNDDNTGITAAVVADCENFQPVAGTEKVIVGIDTINICTGLVSDDQLITKGNEIFGRQCYGAGDAIRIGKGAGAVMHGRQVAFEILQDMGENINYDEYLKVSKEYIDSQQHPLRVIQEPYRPSKERFNGKPFVQIDCLHGFACNPCEFACPYGAISKTSTSTVPQIDFDKCTGCMDCVYQCPAHAIFGYDPKKDRVFLPVEYFVEENEEVYLVDDRGKKLGTGVIEKILKKPNKTNIARVKAFDIHSEKLLQVRGFIIRRNFPEPVKTTPVTYEKEHEMYIPCYDGVTYDEILNTIGEQKFISVDEIKHTTRSGMGACRGKRGIHCLKQAFRNKGISVVGDATPRGPLGNQLSMGEMFPKDVRENIIINSKNTCRKIEVRAVIAGGGIAGSALFRYMSEAGLKPVLLNYGLGSSWRNIYAGRAVFSFPEIADIARSNLEIFKELQQITNINLHYTRYINFAHDEAIYKTLEDSRSWSKGYMVENKDFARVISPVINPDLGKIYQAAFITPDCWQATPGLVIDLVRRIGIEKGGSVYENCQLINVQREGNKYIILVKDHEKQFIELHATHFVNALGYSAEKYAKQVGIQTGLYPVKHQAFITGRLPNLGINGQPLDMLIDRRKYKGFINFYGQQLRETGQIIACVGPQVEPQEADKNIEFNSKEFIEVLSEIIVTWLPQLSSVGFQSIWAGYYVEPRMIVDHENGLLVGLRGHGFMLGQYLAKMYVNQLLGKEVPSYFERLKLSGDGLSEKAFS